MASIPKQHTTVPCDIYTLCSLHPNAHIFDSNPLLYFDTIYQMTANGKKWTEGCRYAHQVAWGLMERRKAELKETVISENGPKRAMDFLDILLLAQDEDGKGLADVEIRQEIDTFLFEGHDTTASAISWCLYHLACHPDFQFKARQEVDNLLVDRELDYIEWNDLSQLPYLTMCIKESLRHTPAVPYIGRELNSPLEMDGVTLEPGTIITIHIWSLHHNPLVWGDDHLEYKPERFSFENTKKMDSHAFLPFSAGSRSCIGQNFAMNELKTVIARILHRFILEADPDKKPQQLPELVMKAKDGIHLVIKQR